MRFIHRLALPLMLAALSSSALAEDITINDPRWLQLTAQQQADLEKKLKDSGAIGSGDRLVYKGKSNKALSELNLPISTVAAALADIGKGACRQYNSTRLAACRKVGDPSAKQACRDNENARFEKAKATCG